MKRGWFTKVDWSVKVTGKAELSAAMLKRAGSALRTVLQGSAYAVVLLCLVSGDAQLDGDGSTGQRLADQSGSQSERVITTEIGEHRDETLPGGALAVLNTATRIHTHSTPSEDEVSLEAGELLLDNTRPGSKRVRVAAGSSAIEADGARFSVRQNAGGVYVAKVYDGHVVLALDVYPSSADRRLATVRRVRLTPGRSASIQPSRVVLSPFDADDAPRLLAWMNGLAVFERETLADAVADLNRYNRQQIVIGDGSIKRLRVGGAYRTTDPQGFARALEKALGIKAVEIPPDPAGPGLIILISPRGEPSR